LSTVTKKLYEGLFLVGPNEEAVDFEAVCKVVEKILKKSEAELVTISKWDERKLAYEVNGKGRGLYILTYFNADPSKITAIERDVQLSEQIMRALILTTDKMSKEDIEKDTPVAAAKKDVEAAKAAAEQRAKERSLESKKASEAKAAKAAESTEVLAEAGSEPEPAPEEAPAEPEANVSEGIQLEVGPDTAPEESPTEPEKADQ